MLQICNAVMLESLSLVIDEGTDRASQRNHGHRSRRFEAGNQADQIANQNEKCQGHQERREALAVMADDLVALAFDET